MPVRCKFQFSSAQSLNLDGRSGATDDVTTMFLHPTLSLTALTDSPDSSPVQSHLIPN